MGKLLLFMETSWLIIKMHLTSGIHIFLAVARVVIFVAVEGIVTFLVIVTVLNSSSYSNSSSNRSSIDGA